METRKLFLFFDPIPQLKKAVLYHRVRRKDKRDGSEVAFIAVLADKRSRTDCIKVGPSMMTKIKGDPNEC